ncbi:rab17, putative [Entamoeba invadens IP1]|uniref:rab17, putative n=1 Tax=Entamoeba invadens IP1 TaxID=370355 RepID=UPI0002C3F131|nr:rab17, putative [Entamoeba invadens IP1]ELP85062.1 rab17, putative [Entamoeba invadens IP1]|eukprot:XP_004184408.1 rab17, putative [Entamoeba invadens IP1]
MEDQDETLRLKVLVIGQPAVGKTSILRQLCQGTFVEGYRGTIGVEFYPYTLEIQGKKCELTLWDVAGQETSKSLSRAYYNGAHGAIVVYDTTNKETFERTIEWKRDLTEKVQYSGIDIPVLLVGNKSDLLDEENLVKEKMKLNQKASSEEYVTGLMTSAKMGTGIKESVTVLCVNMLDRFKDVFEKKEDIIKLTPQQHQQERCC